MVVCSCHRLAMPRRHFVRGAPSLSPHKSPFSSVYSSDHIFLSPASGASIRSSRLYNRAGRAPFLFLPSPLQVLRRFPAAVLLLLLCSAVRVANARVGPKDVAGIFSIRNPEPSAVAHNQRIKRNVQCNLVPSAIASGDSTVRFTFFCAQGRPIINKKCKHKLFVIKNFRASYASKRNRVSWHTVQSSRHVQLAV